MRRLLLPAIALLLVPVSAVADPGGQHGHEKKPHPPKARYLVGAATESINPPSR